MNGFVQGCLENPRDAPQVHHDCPLVQGEDSKGGFGNPGIRRPMSVHQPVVRCPTRSNQEFDYHSPNKIGIDEWYEGNAKREVEGCEEIAH